MVAYIFKRAGGLWLLGLGLGAIAGAFGSALFLAPLDYCTFEAGRESLDQAFGLILAAAGTAIVVAPLGWLSGKLLRHESLVEGQQSQGAFRHWWIASPCSRRP